MRQIQNKIKSACVDIFLSVQRIILLNLVQMQSNKDWGDGKSLRVRLEDDKADSR